jgi:hypothetical protein
MRKTLKEERSLNEEEEEDGTRFYQCQPPWLTYGVQSSDKNKIFQVRIAGGDRHQCLTGFFPIRNFRLMCKNPGERG